MRETDALQKQIAALEAQVLEKMTETEDAEKILTERADEINSLEGNRTEAVSNFEGELSSNASELEEQTKKRDEVMATIPPNWASVYNRLVQRSQDGIAVAEVVNGSCSACFMSLRPQVQQQLRKGNEIITCENCTRILYIPADDAKAANQES
jgi:predicted  nucleic acid-binding Zn-ribbon protein